MGPRSAYSARLQQVECIVTKKAQHAPRGPFDGAHGKGPWSGYAALLQRNTVN